MTELSNIADRGLPRRADALDPELLALPAPPRARRVWALALMAVVCLLSVGLLVGLRHDLAYLVSSPRIVDLGDVTDLGTGSVPHNRYVRVRGTPMVSRTVRYRRLLGGARYELFPLAGQRRLLVQVPAGRGALARVEYAGRLVTLGDLGGRLGVARRYLTEEMGVSADDGTLVLLADESPGSYAWAALLALLCALCLSINGVLLFLWFRPLSTGAHDDAWPEPDPV
ncbi:MAG: hypothetical protein ACFCGT_17405 [Sandaracinaceae bacterium]